MKNAPSATYENCEALIKRVIEAKLDPRTSTEVLERIEFDLEMIWEDLDETEQEELKKKYYEDPPAA